jgi:uncharacterized RDD family membrane protein YckC
VAITVLKNNVPWGPFTRAQIQDGLARGDFTLQYLAHGPGQKEWLPLGEVLDYFDRGVNLPPVPQTRDLPPVPAPGSNPLPAPTALPPPPAPRPPALPAQPAPLQPPVAAPAPSAPPIVERIPLKPAAFFSRFVAFAIDCGVLFVPVLFLFGVAALTIESQALMQHTDSETMRQEWALWRRNFRELFILVAVGGAWLYAASLECSRWQATVGKQWVGMKVTDAHGEPLSFIRATGRHAAKFLSALPCFLGFTAAFFSPQGLAWHDRLASTRVVKKTRP